jgi:hypothetical protein
VLDAAQGYMEGRLDLAAFLGACACARRSNA